VLGWTTALRRTSVLWVVLAGTVRAEPVEAFQSLHITRLGAKLLSSPIENSISSY
jgi:hypothetical protein